MIFNAIVSGGAAGGGSVLTVNAPAGVIITASNDVLEKTYTRTANTEGIAVFKGLAGGVWQLSMTNGSQISEPILIKITTDYETTLAFFEATINVTYPEGSICTCTDGVTEFTAPDTTGVWTIIVPNEGRWDFNVTDGNQTDTDYVEITAEGQVKNLVLAYFEATINVTYPEGSSCECVHEDGTKFTAPDANGIWIVKVPKDGRWTISCYANDGSEDTDTEVVEITTEGQNESVILRYWNGELYDAGNEYIDYTGGWRVGHNGQFGANAEKGEDYMWISSSATNATAVSYASTNKAVDATGYSQLNVRVSSAIGGIHKVYFGDAAVGSFKQSESATTWTAELGSTASGVVKIENTGYSGGATGINIVKVWLS